MLSDAIGAIFGSTDLNVNFFLQAKTGNASYNIFYTLIFANATSTTPINRVFFQNKTSMNQESFLIDRIASTFVIAESNQVTTLLVSTSGKLTSVVYVLQNLPS